MPYISGLNRKHLENIILLLVLYIFPWFSFSGCNESVPGQGTNNGAMTSNSKNYPFPYQLEEPNAKYKLPSVLKEISGLAWVNETLLATVQDEKGNIYLFDLERGEVTDKIDFGGNGDYEGIAIKGDDLWVVRSDGRLYEVKKDGSVNVIDTSLDEDFDVEGLEWYPEKEVFLLACKGFPGQGKALKNKKTCYAFDPASGLLDNKPFLIVDLAEVAQGKKRKPKEDVNEFFNPGKGNKVFQPSGVGVHPVSGDIYLISSVGKKLLVLSPKGKLLHIASLDYSHFPQPEGICFSPNGIMYISTEGDGGKGKIYRFDPA